MGPPLPMRLFQFFYHYHSSKPNELYNLLTVTPILSTSGLSYTDDILDLCSVENEVDSIPGALKS